MDNADKGLLAIILGALLAVCTLAYIYGNKDSEKKQEVQEVKIPDSKIQDNPYYKTVIIDSCEYVVYNVMGRFAGAGGICHKGNCKYCAKRK